MVTGRRDDEPPPQGSTLEIHRRPAKPGPPVRFKARVPGAREGLKRQREADAPLISIRASPTALESRRRPGDRSMKPSHIAYHTTDEVNLAFATQAARECGASLSRLADPVARPSGAFAAVLHDLDHMDSQRERAVVSELLSGPAAFPV